MNREKARNAILAEWKRWDQKSDNFSSEVRSFFDSLKQDHPDLLLFPYSGNKWHSIRVWIEKFEESRRA
jgi:hypothetical protein